MIYVSFMEIMVKAREALVAEMGMREGSWITVLSFFAGVLFIGIIDKLVPTVENPHEIKMVEDMENASAQKSKKLIFTNTLYKNYHLIKVEQEDSFYDVKLLKDNAHKGEKIELEIIPDGDLKSGNWYSSFRLIFKVEGLEKTAIITIPVKIVIYWQSTLKNCHKLTMNIL